MSGPGLWPRPVGLWWCSALRRARRLSLALVVAVGLGGAGLPPAPLRAELAVQSQPKPPGKEQAPAPPPPAKSGAQGQAPGQPPGGAQPGPQGQGTDYCRLMPPGASETTSLAEIAGLFGTSLPGGGPVGPPPAGGCLATYSVPVTEAQDMLILTAYSNPDDPVKHLDGYRKSLECASGVLRDLQGFGEAAFETVPTASCPGPAGPVKIDYALVARLGPCTVVAHAGVNSRTVQAGDANAPSRVQQRARTLLGSLRSGCEPASAPMKEVFSTPKHRTAYYFDVAIPTSWEWERDGRLSANFDDLYRRSDGEIEVVFRYRTINGQDKQKAFRQSVLSMKPPDAAERDQRERDGDLTFVLGRRLRVGHKALDELEAITREPGDELRQRWGRKDPLLNKDGEPLYRPAEQEFDVQVVLYDYRGKLAYSAEKYAGLKYVIRVPVVFVPGTAGSHLSANGTEKWPANVARGFEGSWSQQFWDELRRTDQERDVATVQATKVLQYYEPLFYGLDLIHHACNWALTAGCIYKGWVDHMAAQGYREGEGLVLFPYDWRIRPNEHVEKMDAVVKHAVELSYNRRVVTWRDTSQPYAPTPGKPPDKVIVITHSQGGLVARSYINRFPEKVEAVIMMAPTNFGAMKTVKAVGTTGYAFEAPFLDAEVGKSIARNWAAAYFQMPVSKANSLDSFLFDGPGNPVTDTLAEMRTLQTHVLCGRSKPDPACRTSTMNESLLRGVGTFFSSLGNPVDKQVPTFIIGSFSQPTIVSFRRSDRWIYLRGDPVPAGRYSGSIPREELLRRGSLPAEAIVQPSYEFKETRAGSPDYPYWIQEISIPYYEEIKVNCGDNLVALHRMFLDGAEPLYVRGVDHGGYTENATVQKLVDRLLRGGVPKAENKPSCNSQPRPGHFAVGFRVRGSPANIHVYDAQGRHTGLKPDGRIEQAIPGSVLELQGPDQEVWLPYSIDPLRVSLEGLVDTTFDFSVVAGDGKTERRADYVGLRETKSMRGELKFAPNTLDGKTPLALDTNADGKVDETRQPTHFGTFTAPDLPAAPAVALPEPGSGLAAWARFPGGPAVGSGPAGLAGSGGGAGGAMLLLLLLVGGGGFLFVMLQRRPAGARSAPGPGPPAPRGKRPAAGGRHCAGCGAQAARRARFCPRCGRKL